MCLGEISMSGDMESRQKRIDDLASLYIEYRKSGNYDEAICVGTELINEYAQIYGKENIYYASLLGLQAICYNVLGNYTEAIRLCTETIEIIGRAVGTENSHYAAFMDNLAVYNSKIGYYAEAIRLGTEAMRIRGRVLGPENPDYAKSLDNLSGYYNEIGNYAEAIRLCTQAMEIQGKVLGTESADYASSLNLLALYNFNIGNYAEAIRLGTEALGIRGRVIGTEDSDYATSLDNLSVYNSEIGNYAEAIRLCTEAMEIRKRVPGTEKLDYANSLNNLANYNYAIGNYAEAIRLCTEALGIQIRVVGTENKVYATSLANLAYYNYETGNYAEAIRLGTEALEIRKRVVGTEHPDYAFSLGNQAVYYKNAKNRQEQYYYTIETTNVLMRIISSTFADLSSKERSLFWDKYKYWFERQVHAFSYDDPCDPLSANGYNSVLLGKGPLLNSDIEFSRLIEESGDTAMERVYTDLRSVRAQITKTEEKYRSADSLQFIALRHKVDSLSKIAESKEKTLLGSCKVYGDYTKNLVITWEQVREKLGDDDVAIEFVSFPWNADSTMYIAYALRRDYECPQLITLFEESQLTGVGKGDIYTTDTISSLVWKPLREVTEGASNVYFSPGGELYNIAIESVPTYEDGGKTPMGDYDAGRMFHRLSSTRELALIREENTWDYAAVYGGLEYGMNDVALIADMEKYPARRDLAITPDVAYNIADTLRESLSLPHYLEGTAQEAIAVSDNLTRADIATKLLMDTLGTEASFKDLSGRRTSILHIGTHGFFNKEKKRKTDERQAPPAYDNMARHISEDKAMTRSGLLFAGANYALAGNRLPDNVDDGILTAKELTAIDLRGLDIVVLSACQTGLGQITGDGVFGLQRGFKKAGAQTIVMSLWKVDDKATRLFMDRFFENLANNGIHKKRQSFIEAQRYLRHEYQENGSHIYSSPEYWAAFIMLDGE